MKLMRKTKKTECFNEDDLINKSVKKRYSKIMSNSKINNGGLFSLITVTALGCNASQDDQCYGSLGLIAGAFCASQNDIIVNPEIPLSQISTIKPYALTNTTDAIEFKNNNLVTGNKYTLTNGDILLNPGLVSLNLINSGSIDGQKIVGADEIELATQGTSVILTSNWYMNDLITIKDADQTVTLNDLQASTLDSAKAEDNSFYPGTNYNIKNVNAPNQSIFLYFNEEAILGTSTEVNIMISDSMVGIQGGVFTDPTAVIPVTPDVVDPFEVALDTNIEKLNVSIYDTIAAGSTISSFEFLGLETLKLSGGTENYKFEIEDPLDTSLFELNASDVLADLVLDVSGSLLSKTILLGPGSDYLTIGDALVASPSSDLIDGGGGTDKLSITFEGGTNVSPTISSFEEFDLSFNSNSSLDFSKTTDLNTINILESSAGVSFTNVPFDLNKINVLESQSGSWSISFEDNAEATVNLDWANNIGSAIVVDSLGFNEVKALSVVASGADDVSLTELTLDSDDTKLISFTNTDDGNLIISAGIQLDTFDSVTSISLTSTEAGNISLGSAASSFGISEAPKLSTITLAASQTGSIEVGSVGNSIPAEDLQSISISSSGADISLGSVIASKVGTLSCAISSSSTVSFGELNLETPGTSFIATGSGTLSPVTFSNEAYSIINLSDLVTNTGVSFANADAGITIVTGSGNDTITVGLGTDIVTGNAGSDLFIINNGSSDLGLETADIITDFQSNSDKLKLGFLGDGTTDTGNYVESAIGLEDYPSALSAANLALNTLNGTSTATELYAFEYDSNSGYLFIDNDSDGAADELLILSGIESSTISAGDIIA